MQTSVAKIWTKLKVCLCTRPRGAWNKFCALFPASCGRGRNTRGAALNSTSSECSGLWLAKYNKSHVNRPADHKYSKISNSCVSFESNQIASNYSIRFEISNIRTSLILISSAVQIFIFSDQIEQFCSETIKPIKLFQILNTYLNVMCTRNGLWLSKKCGCLQHCY